MEYFEHHVSPLIRSLQSTTELQQQKLQDPSERAARGPDPPTSASSWSGSKDQNQLGAGHGGKSRVCCKHIPVISGWFQLTASL